jgi:hypothetical protein
MVEKEDTKSNPAGSERRRYDRISRRIGVTFTMEGNEVPAYTVDVSKSGARFEADIVPSEGTRLLLNLSDRQNPDLTLYLKARVVRELRQDEGRDQFAVEFGDAVAREPRRLRMFLEKALGIESGLIRVVGDEDGEDRAYAFSFEAIHREGEERIKALHSSLFSSLDEMEEADAILASFGNTAELEEAEEQAKNATSAAVEEQSPAGHSATPAENKPTRRELAAQKKKEALAAKKLAADKKKLAAEAKKAARQERKGKDKRSSETTEIPTRTENTGTGESSEATGTGPLFSDTKTSLFRRLFGGGGGASASKGATLIQTQRIRNVVANDIELPVVYRIGNTRFQGQATRLYCAGIKVETTQDLPQLYAPRTVVIPLAGARKISQIELVGDVTRVRADDADGDDASGGLFEMRLSMRTEKMHLELYRVLLEQLTGESTSPEVLEPAPPT